MFVFMGANQDSYAEVGWLGLDDGSVQDFRADKVGVREAMGSFNRAGGEYRGAGYGRGRGGGGRSLGGGGSRGPH